MKKLFTCVRATGYIEFALPSAPTKRIRIYAGQSVEVNTEFADEKMFTSYNRMGINIKDISEPEKVEPTVSDIEEPTPVVEPAQTDIDVIPEAIAPVEDTVEVPVEAEPEAETEESLMKLTRAQLVAKATELGIEVPNKASKMQLTKLILGQ